MIDSRPFTCLSTSLKPRDRSQLVWTKLRTTNILGNSTVRVIAQNPESFRAGFDLYRARLDKGYSLTDCISMQTMRSQAITDVLTNDAHFDQEGFSALLREGSPS
jgi:predicted nucleic acid-binding protein